MRKFIPAMLYLIFKSKSLILAGLLEPCHQTRSYLTSSKMSESHLSSSWHRYLTNYEADFEAMWKCVSFGGDSGDFIKKNLSLFYGWRIIYYFKLIFLDSAYYIPTTVLVCFSIWNSLSQTCISASFLVSILSYLHPHHLS